MSYHGANSQNRLWNISLDAKTFADSILSGQSPLVLPALQVKRQHPASTDTSPEELCVHPGFCSQQAETLQSLFSCKVQKSQRGVKCLGSGQGVMLTPMQMHNSVQGASL